MLENLLFYNHFGFGDLFVSRELVKYTIANVPAKKYLYAHKHSKRILLDLPVEQVPLNMKLDCRAPYLHEGGTKLLALNTWYAVSPTFNFWRCSLNCLVDLFQKHYETHGVRASLPSIEKLVPKIDFNFYNTAAIDIFLSKLIFKKKVFICNGQTMSGQTRGSLTDFMAALQPVIDKNPDIAFFFTNDWPLELPNIFYTKNIIGLQDNDLCENGYLSTKCDVIIGRGSGTYTYSYLADNFFDPRKTMLCFTDDERTAQWIYPKEYVKAKLVWSCNYDVGNMRGLMESAMETSYGA